MPTPSTPDALWAQYLDSLPADENLPDSYDHVFSFGDSPEMADELGALVVAGEKTATAGAVWSYEAEDEPIPEEGEYSVVLDGRGAPCCLVETVESTVRPFEEVDEQFARDEGEGFESVEDWREAHWAFFSRTLAATERAPSMAMPVVCERFRVVYTDEPGPD